MKRTSFVILILGFGLALSGCDSDGNTSSVDDFPDSQPPAGVTVATVDSIALVVQATRTVLTHPTMSTFEIGLIRNPDQPSLESISDPVNRQLAFQPLVSPDGKSLIYFNKRFAGPIWLVRSDKPGDFVGRTQSNFDLFMNPDHAVWTRDSRAIYWTEARGLDQGEGVSRLDALTGEVTTVFETGYRVVGRAQGDSLLVRDVSSLETYLLSTTDHSLTRLELSTLDGHAVFIEWSEVDQQFLYLWATTANRWIGVTDRFGITPRVFEQLSEPDQVKKPLWGTKGQVLYTKLEFPNNGARIANSAAIMSLDLNTGTTRTFVPPFGSDASQTLDIRLRDVIRFGQD